MSAKRTIAIIGLISSIIGIFVFVTGIESIPKLAKTISTASPTLPKSKESTPPPSKLKSGQITLQFNEGFSFSLEKTTSENSGNIVYHDSLPKFFLGDGVQAAALGPVDYDAQLEAPEPGLLGSPYERKAQYISVGDVICLQLPNRVGYAKVLVTEVNEGRSRGLFDRVQGYVTVKYTVQLNGTRYFK